MSMRADFFGELQKDQSLDEVSRQIEVPPLREAELLEIVSRPADAAVRTVRERSSCRHHHPARRRGIGQGRRRVAAACPTSLDDMWQRDGCSEATATLRLPAQSIELGRRAGRSAPTRFSRAIRTPRKRSAASSPCGLPPCARTASRRGGVPRVPSSRTRSGGSSATSPITPIASGHRYSGGRRDLRRGRARGDLPALGQAARMDRCRARVFGLAQRSRSRATRLAGHAGQLRSTTRCSWGRRSPRRRAWLAQRAEDLPKVDREFIALSIERERKAQARARRVRALVYVLLVGIIGSSRRY